ncbi:MAG: alcohol dehydrogenase catalytic domain-containing protein [Anaerolineales bacterium]|nr:alcohol dehydrogenase catalytic domain-containing protein [Anaerolineales bacterium]
MRPDQRGKELVLGMECAGTVVRVGSHVATIQVGDEVLAVAPHSMGAYVLTLADLVVAKPATLSFEAAATVPIAYLTAYYALHTLGRIRQGERVLIHAAAGGVGLAAVHLALRAGAVIFATAETFTGRAC